MGIKWELNWNQMGTKWDPNMRKRCAIDLTHFLYSYVTANIIFSEVPLQSWQKMFQIVDYNLKISVNHVQLYNVK